ncbi:neuronal acetylcholine receptor subunit alpha-9-I precursor [Oncorhynchus mykiss]|uniref:Neuronal acetylcholine receptor subunit alpha-9-I n=1 Tax=Oncorhynchus mykiss TaxID=8022 RepID=ACH91_ONCMY|nr:neuronal acetylcholine receptor subunit alpha-9-I precursor [Oncorhynchus mykiss]Q8JFN7.1 RecName: Full=Neuronal acetylcholine receptor subunit alpha-9-I; AltName: Full=Nicotinic acetylcholine receptor subunit alpha-9-I; Short=NACHR alpha-9-I; Flags: Precursor [Oncorhynchus mykiss]AAK72491.1 nicotinic acetylcholine receptor alpha 9-I subunit [Oncorhynchus mykiss]
MKTVVLLTWISCWIDVCTSAQGRYAQKLLNDLMENYSSALRPVEDTDKTLNVTLQITLSQIKDMDERNQVLTTYLWIRQTWFDAYLKWDKEEYDGLEVIRIPSNLVWRPDIVLYNKADEEASGPADTNVVLRYNGEITWDMPAITKSSCVVDVSYFPFDWQWCNLTFGSWTYNGNQVDIAMGMDSGDLSDFVENVEWECHGMPAVRNVIMYGCCSDPYPDITYTLHLKRRSLFYIFNLLLPCFLISFLAPLGFYLPADSGEKVSLGVTVLLALTVFQLMVAESMPPSESVPYIGKYYIATMTMITASTSLTIFIMNIHFCGAEAKPVPHWAKVLIIDYMSKILFVYEVGENCTTPESERTPLYSEEPMSGNSALARNHYHDDLYHDGGCYQDDCHRLRPYQYGNGHLQNHHSTHQNHLDNCRYANGGHRDDHYSNRSNQNHHSNRSQTSKGEGGEEKREPLRHYHHIGREELDYQAPPPGNLQNGGLNEPLPYPKEKHLNPASAPACSCPCPHHKQVVYNIQYIANCFREQRATCAKGAEWKKVAKVMDRFFMWIFFIMVFLMSILIIGKAT